MCGRLLSDLRPLIVVGVLVQAPKCKNQARNAAYISKAPVAANYQGNLGVSGNLAIPQPNGKLERRPLSLKPETL